MLFDIKKILLFIGAVAISVSVLAMPLSKKTEKEIQHLVQYVTSTECIYERNGDKHSGKEAAEHILKKYEYYADDIESAEDFIEYSATKSKMSGKKYKIHCQGQPSVTSAEWLLIELKSYRNQHN